MGVLLWEGLGMAILEQVRRLWRSVEEWNEWREENPGVEIDLSNADLGYTNLVNANLSNTIINDAYIVHANLSNANLSRANFSDTNLSRAKLSNANLSRANFSDASLFRADLSRADLSDTQFRRVDLRDANLFRANLWNANFSNANLFNAYFIRTQALNTNFEGATFTGAWIEDWNINSRTNLDGGICEYIYLKSYNRDRRPHDPDRNFRPGEFAQIFKTAKETLDRNLRQGIPPSS